MAEGKWRPLVELPGSGKDVFASLGFCLVLLERTGFVLRFAKFHSVCGDHIKRCVVSLFHRRVLFHTGGAKQGRIELERDTWLVESFVKPSEIQRISGAQMKHKVQVRAHYESKSSNCMCWGVLCDSVSV